jgi:AraC-like DNA-binding protein
MQHFQKDPTISSTVLLSLYNDLSAHRDVFDQGLARFRIDLADLQDFHGYISLAGFVQLFEWLAIALDDPWLGLRISQRAGPDALGAVGYLFLSSGKLATAVQSLSRYLDAVQSSSRIDVTIDNDLVQIRYRIIDDQIAPRRQDSEYSIGIIWRYIKLLSKNRCRLTQVAFEHEPPEDGSNFARRTFEAPVLFGAEANEITLHLEDFQRWHDGLDPHLFPILEDHISSALTATAKPSTFAETVANKITEQALADGARADRIAAMLKLPTTTLHRRLRSEGFRFKELVDAKSKALAERLLQHGTLPIATVSRRLGFADPATFSRAFRRWFGTTPRDYRKNIRRQAQRDFRSAL